MQFEVSADHKLGAKLVIYLQKVLKAKETTVIPITNFEKLSFKDKATEDLTRNSPPKTSSTKPTIKKKMLIIIYFMRRYTIYQCDVSRQ